MGFFEILKIIMIVTVFIFILAFIFYARIDNSMYKSYKKAKKEIIISNKTSFRDYIDTYRPKYKNNNGTLAFLFSVIIILLWYILF